MKCKAFFFDVDWTLFDHEAHRFVPSGLEAIRKAKAMGAKVFLCTARSYESTEDFGLFDLGIEWDGYVTSCGALAYTDGIYVRKKTIKPKTIRRFDAFCGKLGLCYEAVGLKDCFYGRPKTKMVSNYRRFFQDKDPTYRRYGGEEVVALLLFADGRYDALLRERLPELRFGRYCQWALDASEAKSPLSKGQGIKAILDHYGLKKEEAAAFGDGTQDMTMKEGAGTLVAMGSGRPELKEAADIVADPISEDGLAKALLALLKE